MTTKQTTQKKTTTTSSSSKTKASQQVPALGEATPLPTDESLDRLQAEQDKLHAPGRASKSDAEFIDNDPGYNKDQLAHMREYYGLTESTADVAET